MIRLGKSGNLGYYSLTLEVGNLVLDIEVPLFNGYFFKQYILTLEIKIRRLFLSLQFKNYSFIKELMNIFIYINISKRGLFIDIADMFSLWIGKGYDNCS